MKQTQIWKSSYSVFKDAVRLTIKAWVPVFWLVLGQIVLFAVYGQYLKAIGAPSVDTLNASQLGGVIAFLTVIFLYQVYWSVALARIFTTPPDYSMNNILGAATWKKFFPALVLSVFLSIAISIAGFLFLIPGVILFVYWLMAMFILVVENTSVKQSLTKSYKLVQGWWWPVFARVVWMFLAGTFVSVFAIVPVVGAWITLVLTFLVSPVLMIYIGLTYQELTSTKARQPSARSGWPFWRMALMFFWAILVLALFSLVTTFGEFVVRVSGY